MHKFLSDRIYLIISYSDTCVNGRCEFFIPVFEGKTWFDVFDFLTANIMLPLGGLFIALFVGWCMRREHVRKELHAESLGFIDAWMWVLRYIAPVLVSLVFIMLLWDKLAG